MLKLDLYVYFSQKISAYRRNLMKLHVSLFLIKDDELLEKYYEIL